MIGMKSGMTSKGMQRYPTARPRKILDLRGVRLSARSRRYTDSSRLNARVSFLLFSHMARHDHHLARLKISSIGWLDLGAAERQKLISSRRLQSFFLRHSGAVKELDAPIIFFLPKDS